jgi:adhesin/invasin
MIRARNVVLLSLLALLPGCDLPSGNHQAGPPVRMEIVSGDEQSGVVRTELPRSLVVRVIGERGTPVPGVPVQWVITSGGGTIDSGSGTTDREGLATNRWTLGISTSLPQVVEAQAVGRAGKVLTARFRATPTPGAAVAMEKRAGHLQTGVVGVTLRDSLTVLVLDADRNPVPGISLTWSATAGRLSNAATATRSDGTSRVAWTLGARTGEDSVRVLAGQFGTTFTATVIPGASASTRAGHPGYQSP